MASLPLSTTDWLNVPQLDAITGAPGVGQKMWFLSKLEDEGEMKMHMVTVTTSSVLSAASHLKVATL